MFSITKNNWELATHTKYQFVHSNSKYLPRTLSNGAGVDRLALEQLTDQKMGYQYNKTHSVIESSFKRLQETQIKTAIR